MIHPYLVENHEPELKIDHINTSNKTYVEEASKIEADINKLAVMEYLPNNVKEWTLVSSSAITMIVAIIVLVIIKATKSIMINI